MTAREALNRLAKWRALLAGWQLGTRAETDPECRAVRDHREVTLMLRAEVSALLVLLETKKVISRLEWEAALATEAMLLDQDLEKRWPGVHTTDQGLSIDLEAVKKAGWMEGWLP